MFLTLLLVTINVDCNPNPSQSKYSGNYQNPGCATQTCNYEYPLPEKPFELPPSTTELPEPGKFFFYFLFKFSLSMFTVEGPTGVFGQDENHESEFKSPKTA